MDDDQDARFERYWQQPQSAEKGFVIYRDRNNNLVFKSLNHQVNRENQVSRLESGGKYQINSKGSRSADQQRGGSRDPFARNDDFIPFD